MSILGIGRRRRRLVRAASRWLGLAVILLALASPLHPWVAPAYAAAPHGEWHPGRDTVAQNHNPIQHVVIVMKENHTWDNLFAAYCMKVGRYCSDTGNGIPPKTCIPIHPSNPSSGCEVPFNLSKYQMRGGFLPHLWDNSHNAYANGSMNGWWGAEGDRNMTFGHYNASTVPFYWDLAEEYASGDNFFSSTLSYSLPNHWYLMAASSPPAMEYYFGAHLSHTHLHTYLNQANQTRSVQDLLANHPNVTWKYYDWSLPPYQQAINAWTGGTGSAYDLWNPLAAQHESYTASYTAHYENRTSFFTDALNGTLPNVTWLIPPYNESDHPGASLTTGSAWTASVIDALEASPEWNSTAIFLTWDEYGGWYDHVAPPSFGSNWGYGFRVPLLVISPYAKENQIVHEFGSFDSILQFVEWRFGLGCLNALDCNSTRLSSFFDFHQAPRAPIIFSTNMATIRYPVPLQNASTGAPPLYLGSYTPASWQALYNADQDPWAPAVD